MPVPDVAAALDAARHGQRDFGAFRVELTRAVAMFHGPDPLHRALRRYWADQGQVVDLLESGDIVEAARIAVATAAEFYRRTDSQTT